MHESNSHTQTQKGWRVFLAITGSALIVSAFVEPASGWAGARRLAIPFFGAALLVVAATLDRLRHIRVMWVFEVDLDPLLPQANDEEALARSLVQPQVASAKEASSLPSAPTALEPNAAEKVTAQLGFEGSAPPGPRSSLFPVPESQQLTPQP
jgi:hypothetical protein